MCTMMSVICPLCANSSFASIDALRVSLIKAANGPLPCPICNELFLGLDKLTIHLFSHTSILPTTATTTTAAAATTKTHGENSAHVEKTLEITSNTKDAGIDERATRNHTVQQQQDAQQNASKNKSSTETPTTTTCDICEFNFSNPKLLDMHYRLVHQIDYQTSQAQDHQQQQQSNDIACKTNTNNNNGNKIHDFKCHLCPKTFKMKGPLRVHLKVVHLVGVTAGNNKSSLKLSICERIRHKEEEAAATAMSNSTNLPQSVSFLVNTTHPVLTLPSGTTFTSNQLDDFERKVGENNELLLQQQQSATSASIAHFTPQNVLFVLSAANLLSAAQEHQQQQQQQSDDEKILDCATKTSTENAKIWECNVCSKSFTTKYFLKKHKRLHTGEMPYTCEICGRAFTFQQSYHKHLLYHSDEKPHVCATCGRAFKELSTLHNHERIHSGEKPFKCEVCDKSFRQRVSFLVHTRIHTGVLPYKCEICEKKFRYKVSQRTHKCLTPGATEITDASPNELINNEDQVDHISESFIKAFLENTTVNNSSPIMHESQNSPLSAEIAAITLCGNSNSSHKSEGDARENHSAKNAMDEMMLSKTIDDIVVESCNKMGIGNSPNAASHLSSQYSTNSGTNGGCNSPSFRFQNMRLYSPDMMQQQLHQQHQQQQHMNGETNDFSHFLLGDMGPPLL